MSVCERVTCARREFVDRIWILDIDGIEMRVICSLLRFIFIIIIVKSIDVNLDL